MARKKDYNYYESFVTLSEFSVKAAELLDSIMKNYNVDELESKMKEMHEIEHSGDLARHAMVERLSKEFITPIEREDIMSLADSIDDVTDKIEDVLMRMYMFNVTKVRDHGIKMAEIIVKCCNALKDALVEFHNFRKSQNLHELLVKVNVLEEEGDKLYMEATRDLCVNCSDLLEVIAWEKIFYYLESCCDACEDVANVIEIVIMKNS